MYSCTPENDHQVSALSGCACCRPLIQSVTRRINAGLSRRGFVAGIGASLATLGFVRRAGAQPEAAPPPIVFTNFRLFDGRSAALRAGLSLLVERDRIKAIEVGDVGAPEGARVIDCGGRTLMPGLIDAHWHTIFAGLAVSTLLSAEIGYIFLAASAEAERTLMRGFTTVRDLGGPAFALKQAIDDGTRSRAAHLSVRCHDHDNRRAWRFASALRSAAPYGRAAQLSGAEGRCEHRRHRRRGAAAGARAAAAGGLPDQARGRRRSLCRRARRSTC